MPRRRRSKEELEIEAGHGPVKGSAASATPLVQRIIELQRDAGNEAVTSILAPASLQRQTPTDAPVDLRRHLLDLNGISALKIPDPTPPWLPARAPESAKKDDHDDDSLKVWKLDFDLDADDNSPLGQELARSQRIRQILSGGKGDADTPLGLQLTNAAVNILANTDKGQELATRLHLDHFSVVVDPVGGNYGLTAQFKFGK